MSPLSVLFLNPLGERDWGGVETWMFAVAKGLAAGGHVVAACARRESRFNERFAEQGFPVETLAFRRDFGPLDVIKLRRIQRRRGIDAVVTKLDRGIRAAGLASSLGGGAAVVMRQGLFEVKDGFRHRFAYRWVDCVITPARTIRERIIQTGVLDGEHVDHVPNGVDADRFQRDPGAGEAFREAGGLPPGKLLVNTSRLHDQKGLDTLLTAFAKVPGEPGLVLAGAGKREADLRRQAGELAVADRVFFPGHVSDVPGLLSAADVFVLSSRFEGMPNNVLEAMACGLPIVATKVGDVPDMLKDGRDALLCNADDADGLAAGIRWVIDDEKLAARLGAAAADRARSAYPVTTMVERTTASIAAAVASRATPERGR